MRLWVAIGALLLLAGCSGASHPAAQHSTSARCIPSPSSVGMRALKACGTSGGAVVTTNCPSTTTTLGVRTVSGGNLHGVDIRHGTTPLPVNRLTATPGPPPGGVSSQESIKQAGQNGGGCYENNNRAHPLGPGTSAP